MAQDGVDRNRQETRPTVEQIVGGVEALPNWSERVPVLRAVATRVAALGEPAQALRTVQLIASDSWRGRVLGELVEQAAVSEPLLRRALDTAHGISGGFDRAWALARLAAYLPDALKAEALRAALAATRELMSYRIRASALETLAPYLTEDLLVEAVADARGLEPNDGGYEYRDRALRALQSRLRAPEALAAVRAIRSDRVRAEALEGLMPRLSGLQLHDAIHIAQTMPEASTRAGVLARLIAYLPEPLVAEASAAAVAAAAQAIETEGIDVGARVLREITPLLPEGLQAETLARLAPGLPRGLRTEVLRGFARHQPEGLQVERLARLAPRLPAGLGTELLAEALAAAGSLADEALRAQMLPRLAPLLNDELLPVALAAARAIHDQDLRLRALMGLTLHVPTLLSAEVLAAVAAFDPGYPGAVLLVLETASDTGLLDEESRKELVLSTDLPRPLPSRDEIGLAVDRGPDGRTVAWILVGVGSHLPEPLRQEVLLVALHAVEHAYSQDEVDALDRVQLRAALGVRLRQAERLQVLERVLVALRNTLATQPARDEPYARVLAWLAAIADQATEEWDWETRVEYVARLPAPVRTAALGELLDETAGSNLWDSDVADRLRELAPHLPKELFRRALKVAAVITIDPLFESVLRVLAAEATLRATPDDVDWAFACANAIVLPGIRVEMLLDLAVQVAEPLRERVLLKAILEARYPVYRSDWGESYPLESHLLDTWRCEAKGLLAHVVDRALDEGYPRIALIAACAVHDGFGEVVAELEESILAPADDDEEWLERELAGALAGQAAALPTPLLQEALIAVETMQDDENRARALAGLASYLPEALCEQAFAIAHGLADPDDRMQLLARIATAVASPPAEVSSIGDQRLADELVRLAPRLPLRRRAEVLAAAREIENPQSRMQAIVGLGPHLPEVLRVEALAEALDAARAVENEHRRVEALRELAPHLSEPLLTEALAAARAIQRPYLRAVMLQMLAQYLPEPLATQALAEAWRAP